MRKHLKSILLIVIGLISFGSIIDSRMSKKDFKIKTQWVDKLDGDFNFKTKWNYPEGIFRNQFGQLSCDGFCPQGIESMIDTNGKIYSDSLNKFYQLVDTTHQFHSISCNTSCEEWAGTDFITITRLNKNHIICSTLANAGTHCCLILEINKETCIPKIEINSISSPGTKNYYCKSGFIKIDKEFWKQGILKADFDFNFDNTDSPDRKLFWKGKIFSEIEM